MGRSTCIREAFNHNNVKGQRYSPFPWGCTRLVYHLPAFAPAKGRRNKRKDTGASSGADEVESEPEPPAHKKPRSQPRRKSKRLAPEPKPVVSHDQEEMETEMETDTHSDKLTDLEDEDEKTKDDEEEIERGEPETSKAAQRGSSRNKGSSQTTSSLSPSRKRPLVGEEDVEMDDIEPVPSPAPEQTQGSVVEEVVVRRKRLRA